MRKTLFALTRVSASCLIAVAVALSANPVAAHADTFSFTPDNGPTYNFSLDPSQINFTHFDPDFGANYFPVTVGSQTDAEVIFYIPTVLEGYNDGPLDFGLNVQDPKDGFNLYFGPQLFSGSVYNPTFIPGTYTLSSMNPPQSLQSHRPSRYLVRGFLGWQEQWVESLAS
jgi:hypothetical protein